MKRNWFAIFLALALVVTLALVVAPTAQAASTPNKVLKEDETFTVESDMLLDLAGFNATVEVAEGKTLSVIDSGNIGKEGTAGGTLTIAEGSKGTVAVEAEDTTGKRYLKVATGENTYSFHPFYLTIKQIGVNTSNTALCLQAMFVTTEVAQGAIETGVIYGETEMTSAAPTFGAFKFNDGVMYAYYDLMGSLVDEKGNEPEGFENPKSFQAYITVGSESVYSRTVATFSPKQVIENLNIKAENAEDFSEAQREKMVIMITGKRHLLDLSRNFLTLSDNRDMADSPLTLSEKAILSTLTPADWEAGGKKVNLQNVANWAYGEANIFVKNYLDKTLKGTLDLLFVNDGGYGPKGETETNSKYYKMLLDKSWGGAYFKQTERYTLTADQFKIGDIFCGIAPVTSNTVYWAAIYQGNGKFLVVQNASTANDTWPTDCFVVDNVDDMFNPTDDYNLSWRYYYVLRPQNLAETQQENPETPVDPETPTEPREISTGVLTNEEKAILSALTPTDWETYGKKTQLKNTSIWVYEAAGVKSPINGSAWNVFSYLFNTGKPYSRKEVDAQYADYEKMLVDKSWGGSDVTSEDQNAITDIQFEVGDIFCGGAGTASGTGYWIALYQGNGKFLVVQNGGGLPAACFTVDSIDKINNPSSQNEAITGWKYYYVLRLQNLATAN